MHILLASKLARQHIRIMPAELVRRLHHQLYGICDLGMQVVITGRQVGGNIHEAGANHLGREVEANLY